MARNYNEQAFTPEDVEKGLHIKLINALLDLDKDRGDNHFDIRITTDGYCTIIQWYDANDQTDSAGFRFVDSGESVMQECVFPDGHIEYIFPDESKEEEISEWLERNPGWKLTEYGTWYNEEEQRKRLEEFQVDD